MVEVDEAPKEREVPMGDAGYVKRERRVATNLRPSPPQRDVLFSLLFFCVLFSPLLYLLSTAFRPASDKEGGRTKRRGVRR